MCNRLSEMDADGLISIERKPNKIKKNEQTKVVIKKVCFSFHPF